MMERGETSSSVQIRGSRAVSAAAVAPNTGAPFKSASYLTGPLGHQKLSGCDCHSFTRQNHGSCEGSYNGSRMEWGCTAWRDGKDIRSSAQRNPWAWSCGRAVAAAVDLVQAGTHTLRDFPVCLADGDLPAASH